MNSVHLGGKIARVLAGLFLACCFSGLGAQARAAVPAIAVQRYDIDITLTPTSGSFTGSVETEFTRSGNPQAPLLLDMADGLKVVNALLDHVRVTYTHASNVLRIDPAKPMADGPHTLIVQYQGHNDRHGLQFATGPEGPTVANYGMPYTARQWWPCFDAPAVKAGAADILITLPEGLTAVSNGSLVGVTPLPSGMHRYHWVVHYPIYPDVISIAAAGYAKLDASYVSTTGTVIPVQYYVFPSDVALARAQFGIVPSVLKAYENLFGPYPFQKEKYGIAEVAYPSFREHQTVPSLGKGLMEGTTPVWDLGDVGNVIAHDMAHQWFGNSLTPRSWSDVWLNEGFSTYAVALWRERDKGEAAYREFMRKLDTRDFEGSLHIADEHDLNSEFTSTTFNKGAWVLHMLRHVMGDAGFFAALKDYAAANRYKSVDTAAWKAACERQYGKSLDWFFQEWVYGEGRLALKSDWQQADGKLSLKLAQTQAGQLFKTPLDLRIETDAGAVEQTVWLQDRQQSFQFTVSGKVKTVVVDPDDWLLKD